MIARHMTIEQLPYGKPVQSWLKDRYGETEANQIWEQTQENYRNYLRDLPDYGGSKNGHARAIYGGLLIFSLYPALPDQPPSGLRTAGLCTEPVYGAFYKAREPSQFSRVFSEMPGSLRRDKGIQQTLIHTIADKTPKSSDSGVFCILKTLHQTDDFSEKFTV